jgi:hypothetical protein
MLPGVGSSLRLLLPLLLNVAAGIVVGALVLAIVSGVRRVLRPRPGGGRTWTG